MTIRETIHSIFEVKEIIDRADRFISALAELGITEDEYLNLPL